MITTLLTYHLKLRVPTSVQMQIIMGRKEYYCIKYCINIGKVLLRIVFSAKKEIELLYCIQAYIQLSLVLLSLIQKFDAKLKDFRVMDINLNELP